MSKRQQEKVAAEAPVPASITVTETVTLKAADLKYNNSYGGAGYYTFRSLSIDDVEEFVRVARRELDPAAITIRPGEGTITATQSTKTDR